MGQTPWSAIDPLAGSIRRENMPSPSYYFDVTLQYRSPHVQNTTDPVFLTWRLHGSLPPNRFFASGSVSSGQAFAALNRLLDEARAHRRPFLAAGQL